MFKKEDIKVGMIVDIQGYIQPSSNGLHLVVFDDEINEKILVHSTGHDRLSKFDKMLKSINKVRIDKIYSKPHLLKDITSMDLSLRRLLWERKEQKEMTIAEIEKELGYSIKIIKE